MLYGKEVVGMCEKHKTSICPALLIQLSDWIFFDLVAGKDIIIMLYS